MSSSGLILLVGYLTAACCILIIMYVRNEELGVLPKERDYQRVIWFISTLVGLSIIFFIYSNAGT